MSKRRKDDAERRPPPKTAGETRRGSGAPVVVNGWTLLFWVGFRDRWNAMKDAVRLLQQRRPDGYANTPDAKFLRTVRDLIFKDIPANPDHPHFRQGKTLGAAHTHWRRAKFHRRFRLFFRFHTASRTIIYAWLNDENTLRIAGSHTDPYAVFHGMLERGAPPSDWDALVKACDAVRGGPDSHGR